MTSFTLELPRIIYFGAGACQAHLLPALRSFGINSVFVIAGRGVEASGLLAPLQALLGREAARCATFVRPTGEPTDEIVDAALGAWKTAGCDGVVGFGGGSAMDVAKCVSVLATNGGRFSDIAGMYRIPRPGVPMILVPTSAGSGSEVTPAAVITDTAGAKKRPARSHWLLPDAVIADPSMTLTLPPAATADSGLDALTTALEALLSRRASPFSDLLALEAASLVGQHLPRAVADGSDLQARTAMSRASILIGMAFSAAGVGPVHALSNPLDVGYRLSHGRANAVLLGPVLRFNAPACGEKMLRLARALGDREPAMAVAALLGEIDVPSRLRDYGVPADALPSIARAGWEGGRHWMQNGPRSVELADALAILEDAW